jgi:hypothetical protein
MHQVMRGIDKSKPGDINRRPLNLLSKAMQSKLHQSSRSRQAKAAAHSAAAGFETLESRQFMSVAPSIGSVGMVGPIHATTLSAPKAPAVPTGTKTVLAVAKPATAVQVNASAAVNSASGGTVVVTPPGGGNTVAAKKSLWGKIKGAAKWAKDHIVIGLHNIGIKGTF